MKTERKNSFHAKLVVTQARKGISASDMLCVMNQVLLRSPQSRLCHDLALMGCSGWAVVCKVSHLLHMSCMICGRFTFHMHLGKLSSQRFNDPVLIFMEVAAVLPNL